MFDNLRIQINPSRVLLAYLLALYSGAVVSLFLLPLPSLISIGCSGLLLVHLVGLIWKDVWLKSGRSITGLLLAKDCCRLVYGQGAENWKNSVTNFRPARLGGQHFVTNKLVILQVLLEGKGRAIWLPLFVDAVEPESFRRLRVRLRFPMTGTQRSG